ncbi:MAG: hypothetical protein RQ801_04095 [Spirochaetaceae bacterium]|nr:hypothetical protein [Spirochaetaceae bacterium]MDT8297460.1 hypothetical protein [Spirochaetaceae bacterium]
MMSQDVLFPLTVAVVENSLFITDDGDEQSVPIGSRIISINGRSDRDVLEKLHSTVTSDGQNQSGRTAKINHQFAHYYHLMVDRSSSFDVAYIPPNDNIIRHAALPGRSGSELYGS